MEKFNFDTGMKEFEINDAVTVSFNPTDPETIKKIFDVFDSLDAKQAAYKAEIARCGETKEIFDIASRRDAEMREVLDSLFGKPICEPLFGTMNVYELADGLPVWCNLMLAIIDQIDTRSLQERKGTSARIEQYTKRWKK